MRAGAGVRSATVTVGREAETDILARAMTGAQAGQSGCTLLVGEGGVGKSRLLHDMAAAARRDGISTAAGRAAISAPAPFSLIAEALRILAARSSDGPDALSVRSRAAADPSRVGGGGGVRPRCRATAAARARSHGAAAAPGREPWRPARA